MGLACMLQHRVLTGQAVGRSGASPCEGRMTPPTTFPGSRVRGQVLLEASVSPSAMCLSQRASLWREDGYQDLKGLAPVNPGT